jgi:YD repeat-containing protein
MTDYQGSTTGFHVSMPTAPFQSVLVEEAGRLIRRIKDHGYQKTYGFDVTVEVFDSYGRLRSVRYASGDAHAMHGTGRTLQAIVDQWTGETLYTFERDASDRHIVAVVDSTGQRFRYAYDDDRLVSKTAPDGAMTRYRYDEFYNLIEITVPEGHRLVFDYKKKKDWLVWMQAFGVEYHFEYRSAWPDHDWTIRTDNRGNLVRWDYHGDTTLVTTAKCLDEKPG